MQAADQAVSDWRERLAERAAVTARAMSGGAWEWRLDQGLFTCDGAARRLFGLEEGEPSDVAALARRLSDEDRRRFVMELDEAAKGVAPLDSEVVVRAAGGRRWVRSVADLIRDAAGRPLRLVGLSWDNTLAQRLGEALHDGEERLRTTLGSIDEGVITALGAGEVTFLNAAAEALTGWSAAEAVGRQVDEVLRLDRPGGVDPTLECLRDRATRRRIAARLRGQDGVLRDVDITASPMRARTGEVVGAVLVIHDVTEQRALEARLRHVARHDALTGLPNRLQLEEALAAAPAGTVLCYLDIDQFKIINDTAGHAAGDQFLRQVGDLFARRLEPGDLLARLGGDEFAWLMHDVDLQGAEARAVRLVQAMGAFRFHWDGRVFNVGASAGLCAVEAGMTPGDVLSQADVACYAAKADGRGRVSIYREGEASAAMRHREIGMAANLREVIRQGRLVLHAQPIVRAGSATPGRYVELLVRMIGEDGSLVPPGAFIPAAERFDLMGEIDRWVLGEALERLGPQVAAIPDLRLAINLSGNSLNDPALAGRILEIVERSPAPSARLTFEITETAALNNLRAASEVMGGLKGAGCRIALDDFGVGLSSFAYLKSFPVDCVKIDGSFIRNIAADPTDRAIVESMNALAHRLGAETVAEFVEDEATAGMLRDIGVDYLQGYAFGRPRPFTALLAEMTPSSIAAE